MGHRLKSCRSGRLDVSRNFRGILAARGPRPLHDFRPKRGILARHTGILSTGGALSKASGVVSAATYKRSDGHQSTPEPMEHTAYRLAPASLKAFLWRRRERTDLNLREGLVEARDVDGLIPSGACP